MNKFLPDEHYIFTSENPAHESKFGEHHPTLRTVMSFLNKQGETAEIVNGQYGGVPENSILVHHPKNIAGLHQLASDLGQESGLYSKDGKHQLHYYNGPQRGNITTGSGTKFSKEKPDDNYTMIHSNEGPVYFSHNFDDADSPEKIKTHEEFRNSLKKIEGLQKSQPIQKNKVRDVADQYAANKGIKINHDIGPVKINPERASKIASAYHTMEHNPNHPDVQRSYNALVNETADQFHHIKNSGLKISKIQPGMENPYKNGSKDLFHDVHNNNHLWYFPTEQGFGATDSKFVDHPLLRDSGVKDEEGKPMPSNDLFRIVHDYFGHAKEKNGFGPKGEEEAWRHHKQLFSPEAQRALTAETRGQNSWVNFGPHGKHNRANPDKTIYADQKAGILPDWTLDDEDKLHRSEKSDKDAKTKLEKLNNLRNALENRKNDFVYIPDHLVIKYACRHW